MQATDYIEAPVRSLLDVGCNVGAFLGTCTRIYPTARLSGVEINQQAIVTAKLNVPSAQFYRASADELPFEDASFQYVTCIEVLEHLPAELRPTAFREIHRVLEPGGRFVFSVPHKGWFEWMDSNNLRYRLPRLYELAIGSGRRDANYEEMNRKVEWHCHFTVRELMGLAGDGWSCVAVRRGGLFVSPLMDILSWPFYRLEKANHPVRRFFERMSYWDSRLDFGTASYRVMVVLQANKTAG